MIVSLLKLQDFQNKFCHIGKHPYPAEKSSFRRRASHGKRLAKKGFNKKSSQMSSLRCMHRELATDAVHIM